MSLLVIMGSGETAPTMIKTHRRVLEDSPEGPAVMLDTPFGFQRNADDLVARTRQYFADSVGRDVEVADWRRADAPVADREQALALLSRAGWIFAGPGSPTYALRQWSGTPFPDAITEAAERGATVVFGSAAACTLGTHTVPVYEIYKVGEDPFWAPGLDLLGSVAGIHAVVIPHYDNAEGGQHDTRFCYLGEERLALLEDELPEEVGVLGVDEHTALVIDTAAGTARVTGSGVVTVRRRQDSTTFPDGAELTLAELTARLDGSHTGGGSSAPEQPRLAPAERPGRSGTGGPDGEGASLAAASTALRARFDEAFAARDVAGCVGAVLELEETIRSWSADTMQNDQTDRARRALRAMVVRLGELAEVGARDPRTVVGPFVDTLIDIRANARAAKDYATSDLVRDRLTEAGVEVRDTPDGAQWVLTSTS